MKVISITEIKQEFSDVLNQLCYQDESFTLQRHGKNVAVMVSIKEYESLMRIKNKIIIVK